MRFDFLLFAGVLALTANAAESQSMETKETKTSGAAASTTAPGVTPEQSATTACLAACKPGDVDCQAKCISVPSPSTSQVNATNNCVAACPVGKGSASDSQAYQKCVNDCIGQNYWTSSGTPALTTKAKSDSAEPSTTDIVSTVTSDNSVITTTIHSTRDAQATNDASASPSATHNAAQTLNKMGPVVSGLGFMGFLAALFAL